MANLDTAAKRISGVNVGSPWRGLGYFPTGTVGVAERLGFAYLYSGISATAPVTVPDVVGQTQAAGTTTLTGVGFTVSVSTAYSSTVAAGLIISQVPTGGSSAAFGSDVAIVVSLGAAPVVDTVAQTPAGKHKHRRYYVEVDGQQFIAESVDHARAILDRAAELAPKAAALKLERKTTVKSLGLSRPVIKTDAPIALTPYIERIDRSYEAALIEAEIRLLMRLREDDEEAAAYLLL